MREDDSVVYFGEGVRHGGYHLVTAGVAFFFPKRIFAFPPVGSTSNLVLLIRMHFVRFTLTFHLNLVDSGETSLLGAAKGFSQVGLTLIVEIPYAKYLDCGADTFAEIAAMNWLSNGQRPNGTAIRLQGFDRGVFGGNFHTHTDAHSTRRRCILLQ
jgi:pyruvate/2-oxoglutarate/acetoin dehydrogenase E1 component